MKHKMYCTVRRSTPEVLPPGLGAERASLIVTTKLIWANGTQLKFYFFDSEHEGSNLPGGGWRTWKGTDAQKEKVRQGFRQWASTGIGLSFKEVFSREEAEIRIGFMQGDGSWSYIGREILKQGTSERTMNFGWDIDTPDPANGIDTVLHEIGHTLGFYHEHQSRNAGIVWDEDAVYDYFSNGVNNWSREVIEENILRKVPASVTEGTKWDPDSIMQYAFDAGLIRLPEPYYTTGLTPAGGLSAADVAFALEKYPGRDKMAAPQAMKVLQSFALTVANTEQEDFSFVPEETRYYHLRTFGPIDSVLVVFEINDKGEPRYISADDNSGVERDAVIRLKLFRGSKYVIKLRLYYKSPGKQASVMIW